MRRQAHRNRRPGSPRGQGLVNVNLQGIDIVVPVAVAANICDVSVNALASQIGAGETACTTTADAGAVFGPGGSSGGTQQRGLVNVKRRGRHRARAGRRRSEYLRPRRERAGPAEGVWPHDLRGHRPERGVARRSRRQRKASRCSLSTATPTLNCDSSLTWSEAPPARREGGRNLALSAGLRLSAPQPPEGVAHGRGRPGGCPSHIEFFRVPPSERQGTAHRRSDIHTLPGQKAPSLQGLRERVLSRARRPPGQLGGDTARQPSRLPPRPATAGEPELNDCCISVLAGLALEYFGSPSPIELGSTARWSCAMVVPTEQAPTGGQPRFAGRPVGVAPPKNKNQIRPMHSRSAIARKRSRRDI